MPQKHTAKCIKAYSKRPGRARAHHSAVIIRRYVITWAYRWRRVMNASAVHFYQLVLCVMTGERDHISFSAVLEGQNNTTVTYQFAKKHRGNYM
jgi:hypothetical protein